MSTQKKTALVTGASSGIGRETAVKLAENGFAVIAAARRMERLTELADQYHNQMRVALVEAGVKLENAA